MYEEGIRVNNRTKAAEEQPIRLSLKDQQLIMISAIVGAAVGQVASFVGSLPAPVMPDSIPRAYQPWVLLALKTATFILLAIIVSILLLYGFQKLGVFSTE
jgi:hypothetical protein